MDTAQAATEAAVIFSAGTTHEVKTVYVSTFVQVGRFTEREARNIRTWAVQEIAAREGEQAAADFVAECHAA